MRLLLALASILCTTSSQPLPPAGIEHEMIFIARFDGVEQRYILWQPDAVPEVEGRGAIIALHGHGSDRRQFIRDSRDECRAVRDMAQKYAMVVLAPDYRAPASWMGPAAESDLLQLIEDYRRRYNPERIILAGGSMGAASALTFAACHPEIVDGVVAMNGIANHVEYDNFQEAISASFGGNKSERPDEYKRRSAEFAAEDLLMPIAFTLGGADEVTPPESIRRLVAKLQALGRNPLLIERPNGGHATNYEDACKALEHVLHRPDQRP